jgi:exodeoxyribonuclease VII small subunit
VNEPSDPAVDLQTAGSLAADGSFEAALTALQSVVDHLERGRLTLDEAVAWYEVGLGLTRRCQELLSQAELRIRTLEEKHASTVSDDELGD